MYYKRDDRLQKIHAAAIKYPNKTERVFSWLQVITASMASFAHGVFYIWCYQKRISSSAGPIELVFIVAIDNDTFNICS